MPAHSVNTYQHHHAHNHAHQPQGLGATLLRNTPANAVYLGTFEVLKRSAAQQLGTTPAQLPAWAVLSSAGLGGICYWLVIFPVDCIKSAMQTDSIIKSQRKYPDMVTTAKVCGVCVWGGVAAGLFSWS
jgi:solute carrier family 25 carnitine/acylcarnitine transporter 20/29